MQPGEQAASKRELALSWCDEDIISVFKQAPAWKPNGCAVTGFSFPSQEQPDAHVKFGWPCVLKPELRNHEYVFRALKNMPLDQTSGIQIPEVYRTLENGNYFFIVMEHVPGKTLQELLDQDPEGWESQKTALTDSIARAIRLLLSIPVPVGQTPGPVGGGQIRHSLFKDNTSYCDYSSIDELENHLNIVATLRNKTGPTVSLERSLCFYYSDFYAGNFIFTDAGGICVIDFDQAGFLPLSLMSYALAESDWYLGHWLRDALRLPEHNLEAMKIIHYFFMIGVSYIGESPESALFVDQSPMADSKLAVKGLPRPPKTKNK